MHPGKKILSAGSQPFSSKAALKITIITHYLIWKPERHLYFVYVGRSLGMDQMYVCTRKEHAISSWQVSLHAWWPYPDHIYLYAFRSTSYSFSTRTISVYYCVLSIYALISLQRLSFPGPIIHMCAQYFCCNNIYMIDRSAPSAIEVFI